MCVILLNRLAPLQYTTYVSSFTLVGFLSTLDSSVKNITYERHSNR